VGPRVTGEQRPLHHLGQVDEGEDRPVDVGEVPFEDFDRPPEPMEPRFDWVWLSDIFYAVWWPLLRYFIVPGGVIAYPVIHFLPPWFFLRLTLAGLTAGVIYSVVLLLVYLLFRGIFRRRSRYA